MGLLRNIFASFHESRAERGIDEHLMQVIRKDLHIAMQDMINDRQRVLVTGQGLFDHFYDIYSREHYNERTTKTFQFGDALVQLGNALEAGGTLHWQFTGNNYWRQWSNSTAAKDVLLPRIRIYLNPHSECIDRVAAFLNHFARVATERGWHIRCKHPLKATNQTLHRADKIVLYIEDNRACFAWARQELLALPQDTFVDDAPLFAPMIRPGVAYVAAGKQSDESMEAYLKQVAEQPMESFGQFVSRRLTDALQEYMRREKMEELNIWKLPAAKQTEIERFLYARLLTEIKKESFPSLRD